MDYIDFCKKYYATTKIPISLLLGTAGKYSTIGELISVEPLTDYPVLAGGPNPSIHFYSSEIIYGCICIEETDYVIILGPIFECPVTPSQINLFMQESAVPAAYREQIVEFLYTIPTTSRLHLARHLSLLHLILNRKNADIPEILEISFGNTVNRNSHNVEQFIENKENEELHSTHYMELELYEHIRNGNPKKLADFLKSTPLNLNEKKLAKLELKDEEKESARQDMQKMLDYVDKLNELDTSKVEPMTHIFEMGNVFREDEVTNGDDRDAMLTNAPEVKEGQYKVPKTVE